MSFPPRRVTLLVVSVIAAFALMIGFYWFSVARPAVSSSNLPDMVHVEKTSDTTASSDTDRKDTATDSVQLSSKVSALGDARDIRIDGMEWNQGTGIDVIKDGQWIPAAERSAPIIADRPSLVRVFYSLERNFKPRIIRAELTLFHDDEKTVLENDREISGPPDRDILDGTFTIEVNGSDVQPGTRVRVRLLESMATRVSAPEEKIRDLEVLDTPMALHVVIIPASLDCAGIPAFTVTEAMRVELESELYNLFPVSKLDLSVVSPVIVHADPCGDPAAVIAAMAALRESDGASADTLYHAIFPTSYRAVFPRGYETGFSTWEREQPAMGDARVSFSVAFKDNWRNNVAHELGHSLGRPHTFIDDGYRPASGRACGRIDTWGWGPRPGPHGAFTASRHRSFANMNNALYPPTDGLRSHPVCASFDGSRPTLNDFMSYAAPFWVSAYTYSRLAGVIAVFSRWREPGSRARLAKFGSEFSLHGFTTREDGPLNFVWLRGHPLDMPAVGVVGRAVVTFRDASSTPLELSVGVKRSGAGEYAGIVIPLPQGVVPADVARVEYFVGTQRGVFENE